MEYSYIINPITNRKVSIHSRKGQSILKAYLNQVQGSQAGGAKKAGEKKGECLQNPVTKRCGYSTKHTKREVTDENGRKITICTTSGETKKHKYRPCHTSQEYKDYLKRQKKGRGASHVHHHDPAIVEYSHQGEVVRPSEEPHEDPWEGSDESSEGSNSSDSDEASGFGAEHKSEFSDDYCKTTYKKNQRGCDSHPNCSWVTPGEGKSGTAHCRIKNKKYTRSGPVGRPK